MALATSTTTSPCSQQTAPNFSFGWYVGSCVIAGGFTIGVVPGGELSPAVLAGVAMLFLPTSTLPGSCCSSWRAAYAHWLSLVSTNGYEAHFEGFLIETFNGFP